MLAYPKMVRIIYLPIHGDLLSLLSGMILQAKGVSITDCTIDCTTDCVTDCVTDCDTDCDTENQ